MCFLYGVVNCVQRNNTTIYYGKQVIGENGVVLQEGYLYTIKFKNKQIFNQEYEEEMYIVPIPYFLKLNHPLIITITNFNN